MIPTTVTSSSLSTPSPSTPTTVSSSQQNLSMAFKGIAALILEGRAIAEDEFQSLQPSATTATRSSPIVVNAGTYKDQDLPSFYTPSSSGGRRSPGPSTSRAAASSTSNSTTSRHVVNITMNPHIFGCPQSQLFDDIIEDSTFAETTTHQRWTQKLCQLRQASPATTMSRECGLYEQQVAIEVAEPELVALAINSDTANADKAGDYEIVRRVVMNRSNLSTSGGSASSSPGSTDNFLHSLQSLATTCLRGGSPAVETGLRYTGPNAAAIGSIGAPKYSIFRATPPPASRCSNPFFSDVPGSGSSSGSGIQSPHSTYVWSPQPIVTGASGSGCVGSRCNRRDQFKRESVAKGCIATPTSTRNVATTVGGSGSGSTLKSAATASTYPQQGPHCEQFLRKMGLAKGEAAEAEDHFCDMSYVNITCSRWRAYCLKMEAIIQRGEPVCIEVYLGPVRHKILLEQWILTQKDKAPPPTMTLPSLCSAIRSQLYFSQISAWCDLIKKSDKTIYDTERVIFPTPTGAAGDLATSNTTTTSSAGTSPNSASPPSYLFSQRRPRLNIFYRIKQYDSTACFNTKPNVHNFPNVIIGDGCSVSVCLKSLPRINGGIPKLGAAASNGTAADSKTNTNTTASAFEGVVSTPPTTATITTTPTAMATPTTSRQENAAVMATAASPKTNCDTQKASAAAADSVATYSSGSSSSSSSSISDCAESQSKPHKCMFFIDEEDLPGDEQTYDDDDDDCTNGSFAGDSSNSSLSCNLSHREKQLLKYRKRMLKRDKKTTRKSLLNPVQQATSNGNSAQPMEQGDEDEQEQEDLKTKCNMRNSHQECPPPKQEPSKQNISCRPSGSNNHHVAMVSTGTQTQANCCLCGSEKALICIICDSSSASSNFKAASMDDMDSMDSCSISSSDIIHTPRNNAELLLQAIQRTPKAAKKNKKQALRTTPPTTPGGKSFDGKKSNHVTTGGSNASKPESQSRLAGCQLCKRQKTQHNFGAESNGAGGGAATEESEEIVCDEDDEEGDGRANIVTDTPAAAPLSSASQQKQSAPKILDKECFNSSTKLTPHIEKCSLSNNNNNHISGASSASSSTSAKSSCAPTKMRCDEFENTANKRSCTPPNSETANTNANVNGNSALPFNCEGSFKTPPASAQQQPTQHYQQHKQTPKPTLLQFSAAYHGGAAGDGNQTNGGHFQATPPSALHNSLLLRKGLPKVNLTPIFCNPSATASACHSSCFTSSPIPISSCPSLSAETHSFCFDHVAISAGSAHSSGAIVDNNNMTVQKSYSAPALPNSSSPSLSPRFSKQAAIYKRRSRHLSDRSDRSSLGSDEQISDEDLECATSGLYSPATSPMKMRSRTAALFGGRALLGNLEESLLQRRLMPKIEVIGFKVLLGASGGFCPTQLTIPAASYFYELQGAALSTPYVCEIRLPRKGYSVPRAGTVQATLLNPMGTVVRMFVIPYDMRDMPPLHQTFIRQRVLAEAGSNETIEADKYGVRVNVGSAGSSSNNNNHNNNNNNSVSYQNGINGFGSDAESKDCANDTTNYTNNTSSSNNNNYNNNSINNKYRLSPNGGLHGDSNLGHFISAEHMKRLRYSIHLRFQTSRSGRLSLHTDIRLLISRRTDCDTAAAHAKGVLEAPNDLVTDTVMPTNPKYSSRQENPNKI